MHLGFEGILSTMIALIPKSLGQWLLERYDLWDTSQNLPNGKLLIDKEDVYATLGLPIGGLKITDVKNWGNSTEFVNFLDEWRRRWNISKGGPQIAIMDEVILERSSWG